MNRPVSRLAEKAIRLMESGDALRAAAIGQELVTRLWKTKVPSAQIDDLLAAYRALLRRRGYYVSTSGEMAQSLEEIRSLGEGFDLYTLAGQLAALDTIQAECLKQSSERRFPELKPFAPACPCGHHPAQIGMSDE